MKDFTNEQKIAIMNYLITSMGIKEYEKTIEGLCNMGSVFKCIDELNKVFSKDEVDAIITNKDEFYNILFV